MNVSAVQYRRIGFIEPAEGGPELVPEVLAGRERLITEVSERLSARFPAVPGSELDRRIRASYEQFSTSRVQDYLAILVERLVRRDLSADPAQPPAGWRVLKFTALESKWSAASGRSLRDVQSAGPQVPGRGSRTGRIIIPVLTRALSRTRWRVRCPGGGGSAPSAVLPDPPQRLGGPPRDDRLARRGPTRRGRQQPCNASPRHRRRSA